MKLFKRTLCIVLALVMVASLAIVSVSANSGTKNQPLITDVIPADVETKTYYFYMPEDWKNEYNDYYDGTDGSYAAGVYWWGGSYKCQEYTDDWPGYAVTETVEGQPNIFKANVPADVVTIVWNNTVDGGTDSTLPVYTAAVQTVNASSEFYPPGVDTYGFYPDGIDEEKGFDGMIYVCNPAATEVSEYSGKLSYRGEWFYYYGNGEYGPMASYEEAVAAEEVYSNGEFPAYGLQVDATSTKIGIGGTATLTPDDATAIAVSEDDSIITVEQDEETGVVTVTGVAAGTANVIFSVTDINTGTVLTTNVEMTVVGASFRGADNKSLKAGETTSIALLNGTIKKCVSSKPAVAKVTNAGKVSALTRGTTKITVTTTAGEKLSYTVKVTSNPSVKKAITLKVKKSTTLKVTGLVGKATYKSSKKSVATVNAKGKIVAKKAGKTVITVKANGKTLKCTVTVKKK